MKAQNKYQIGTGNPATSKPTGMRNRTKTAWRVAACLLASINGMPALAGTPSLLLKRPNNVYLWTRPALADDGRFYAAGRISGADNGVVAFNSTNLDVAWGPIKPCSSFADVGVSVGSNGLVYAVGDWTVCGDGRLVALNSSGTILWQYVNASDFPRQTPALDDSRARVCFGSSEITAIDYNNHALQWASTEGYYIGGRGIALDAGGNLFVGTYSGAYGNTMVLSFTPSGTLRWARTLGGPQLATVVAVPNPATLLLYDDQNERLLAWNSATGTDAWQAANLRWAVTDTATNLYASAVTNNDVVSLTASGQQRWRRTLTGITNGSVVMDFIDSTGLLYVQGDRTLFALRIADGSTAWQFSADNPLAVPAALNLRGRIFLSDSAGTGYLLDTVLDYAASTWPVARFGNRRHTQKSGDLLPLPLQPPSILVQPRYQYGCLGRSATFTVLAEGHLPLSYQWYFRTNTRVPNGTNASLTLSNLQHSNAGPYLVEVSNPYGIVRSDSAQLDVFDATVTVEVEEYFGFLYAALNVLGQPGSNCELRYTTDLGKTNFSTWTLLERKTMTNSTWFFFDEESAAAPCRYYGVKQVP